MVLVDTRPAGSKAGVVADQCGVEEEQEEQMAPTDRTVRKIVMTRSGSGTGDTIYVDEYGGQWTTQHHPVSNTTATPLTGRVVGNVIVTGKQRK